MAVVYTHLTYEEYKKVEKQMKEFAETSHVTTGGFYHKSIRMQLAHDLILEIHGPLVGGYGHEAPKPKRRRKKSKVKRKTKT